MLIDVHPDTPFSVGLLDVYTPFVVQVNQHGIMSSTSTWCNTTVSINDNPNFAHCHSPSQCWILYTKQSIKRMQWDISVKRAL